VTAVQVVNRFHEVYAKDTLFQQDRINAIAELFAEDARISSLKTGSQYLAGRAAIAESFQKTAASPVEVSKRIFVEPSTASSTIASSSSSTSCSYLLDLHRAGSAPGLGDKLKDAALLYRVQGPFITAIWGAADSERLAQDLQLSRELLLASRSWRLAADLIRREQPLDERASQAHYHNYDQMETWG